MPGAPQFGYSSEVQQRAPRCSAVLSAVLARKVRLSDARRTCCGDFMPKRMTDNDGTAVIPLPDHPIVWSAEPSGKSARNCAASIAELFRWHSSGQASRWPEKGRQERLRIAPTPRRSAVYHSDPEPGPNG